MNKFIRHSGQIYMYIYTTQQIPIIYATQQFDQTTTCTGGNYCCSDYLLCNL